MTEQHATDTSGHGDDHDGPDHGDDAHGGGEELGPIDVAAWGAGAAGVVISLVIALCLALGTSGIG